MLNVEEIVAKLGLDATAFQEGLHRASEKVKDWVKEFAVNPITQFFAVEKVMESVHGSGAFWAEALSIAHRVISTI